MLQWVTFLQGPEPKIQLFGTQAAFGFHLRKSLHDETKNFTTVVAVCNHSTNTPGTLYHNTPGTLCHCVNTLSTTNHSITSQPRTIPTIKAPLSFVGVMVII